MCWGHNGYDQLGDGTLAGASFTPVAVDGLDSGVQTFAAGKRHTSAQ